MASGDAGCYAIGIASQILNVHPQTLRHYERIGLLNPQRSEGGEKGRGIRLYSDKDIARAAQIRRLTEERGVNLAGVEVILNMMERTEQLRIDMQLQLETQQQGYETEIQRLKDLLARVTMGQPSQPREPVVGPQHQ